MFVQIPLIMIASAQYTICAQVLKIGQLQCVVHICIYSQLQWKDASICIFFLVFTVYVIAHIVNEVVYNTTTVLDPKVPTQPPMKDATDSIPYSVPPFWSWK